MKVFISLLLTLLPVSAIAAQLTLPAEFVALRLNGEQLSPSIFLSKTTLELPSGQNVLVLRYSDIFEDDFEDHHVTVKSEPFILLFSVGKTERLHVSYAEQSDKKSARQFAKNPSVSIKLSNGQSIPLINQALSSYENENAKQVIAKRQEIVKKSLAKDDAGAFNKTGPDNLAMLKYWWQLASDEEKQQFIKHQQENQ